MSDDNKVELKLKPEGKPNVLVLGGVGFIGRNLVKYLVDNGLASNVRVADKSLPGASYFNDDHKKAFAEKNIVEFKQADLTKDDHIKRVFTAEHKWDYVINLCGETRFGLMEAEYKLKCLDSATKCSKYAKEQGVGKWVEVSTAQVYDPSKTASTEESKLKPWTLQAQYRRKAEEAVQSSGVPAVILRPGIVFGPGDLTGISPRLCVGAVYQKKNEKLKFMWEKTLRINSVHVDDLCRAIWTACTDLQAGSIYNVADDADLTQGSLCEMLEVLFGIKTGFVGNTMSSMAKLMLSTIAADANDDHVPTWTKLCAEHKVLNTPLSPYIDKELLYNNSLYVDGSKITRDSKFTYQNKTSLQTVKAQLESFIKQGVFPPVMKA